ncbi:MAG: phosphoribosylformylglycinamidine synthase subunit PurQ, partial [Candidatus Levybacteria bacterium]|nr:phosphoribosylformylglycinamidine synthase subunit PurQ [Candidatus Levybacteria bacterium]
GTNRDEEMAFAFKIAGADPHIVHINELRTKNQSLTNFHILGLPGGFSYGDDIVSGKIQAVEMTTFLGDELKKFVQRKNTAVLGVCNGFQVLIRTGLVPFGNIGKMDATLINNDSGHLECRWINMRVETKSRCVFINNETMEQFNNNGITSYPVAHGEGKFFADIETIATIEQSGLVVFRYVDDSGKPTQTYPQNPNGSLNAIGGICDTTGRVLGLMPHPECFVRIEQHPNWRRGAIKHPQGLPLFKNIVTFVKNA